MDVTQIKLYKQHNCIIELYQKLTFDLFDATIIVVLHLTERESMRTPCGGVTAFLELCIVCFGLVNVHCCYQEKAHQKHCNKLLCHYSLPDNLILFVFLISFGIFVSAPIILWTGLMDIFIVHNKAVNGGKLVVSGLYYFSDNTAFVSAKKQGYKLKYLSPPSLINEQNGRKQPLYFQVSNTFKAPNPKSSNCQGIITLILERLTIIHFKSKKQVLKLKKSNIIKFYL